MGDLQFRGGTDWARVALTYGAGLLAFFALAAIVLFVIQYRSLAAEQAELDAQIKAVVLETFPDVPEANVRDGTTAKAIMKEGMDEAIARAAVMADEEGIPPTIDLLYELTNAFPPADEVTVDVRKLTIAAGAIDMRAETDGYTAVSTIEESLQSAERFKNAATRDPKQVRDKLQFEITIPLAGEQVEEG